MFSISRIAKLSVVGLVLLAILKFFFIKIFSGMFFILLIIGVAVGGVLLFRSLKKKE